MQGRRKALSQPVLVAVMAIVLASAASELAWAQEPAEPRREGLLPFAARAAFLLWQVLAPLVAAIPDIPGELIRALATIAATATGGLWIEVIKAVGAFALLIGAVRLLRSRRAAFEASAPRDPLSAIVFRIGSDFLLIALFLVLAAFLSEVLFGARSLAAAFGAALLDAFVRYRLAAAVPYLLFRPGEAELRLFPATDEQVSAALPTFNAAIAVGLGFPTLIPVWIEAGMRWEPAQALAVLVGVAVASLGYRAVARFLVAGEGSGQGWRAPLLVLAIGFASIWAYGVIRLDFALFNALVATALVLITALILSRFCAVALERSLAATAKTAGHYAFWRDYGGALRRSIVMFAALALILILVGLVAEKAPMLFNAWRTTDIERSLWNSFAVLSIGYLLFEGLTAWTRARFASRATSTAPGEEEEEAAPTSRLATVMPILQGFAGALILGISLLIALSKLGIDTTPLIAGAGIFGLAISFGSQSLVRDIVAGIFYMADDAFRVGEYIEAGRLKGSVEKITLRSVRLRHQNGQIHTVPFGQLGAVTNYSRDWVTLKFNLRLARDVDTEMVRKTVKKIGLQMLEDPEIGKEFLQPLKMQGIADILENALLVRFKFTVKPGKPTYIQRQAIKRIVQAFKEQGIEFATNSVVIQNSGPANPEAEQLAAASAGRPLAPDARPADA